MTVPDIRISRALIVTVIGLGVLTVAYFGFGSAQGKNTAGRKPDQGPVIVETAPVVQGQARQTITAIGSLIARESITLRPELDGRISAIGFDSGQHVRKGAMLVQIDDDVLKTDLAAADAALDYAEHQFQRAESLLKTGTGTRRALDEARSERDITRAKREQARARLSHAMIRAPFEGVTGLRRFSIGDYVKIGDMLATLDQMDPIKVEFTMPERFVTAVKPGQQIDILTAQNTNTYVRANITAIAPRIDPQTRLGQIEAVLPNPDQRLKPGQFVPVLVPVQIREDAVLIPETALVQQGEQRFVWVVDAGNKVHKTPVTTGLRLAGYLEILSGVTAGQQIVTAGQQKLRPDVTITPKPATPITRHPDAEEIEIVPAS